MILRRRKKNVTSDFALAIVSIEILVLALVLGRGGSFCRESI